MHSLFVFRNIEVLLDDSYEHIYQNKVSQNKPSNEEHCSDPGCIPSGVECRDVVKIRCPILARKDLVHAQKSIVDGEHDNIPESAFYMVGTIEEALEKSKKISKEE